MSFDKMQRVFTQAEIATLNAYHAEIKEKEHAFLRVGELLCEIRDTQLYGIHAETFEQYIRSVWGWTRQRAYQLIDAAEVVNSLPEKCQPAVDTEKKARELKHVPVEHRSKVINRAAKNGPVTPQSIRRAAAEITDPPEEPASPPPPPEPPEPVVTYDKTGFAVPEHRVVLFNRTTDVEELLRNIARVRGALRRAQDTNDPLFKHVNFSTALTELDNAYGEIKMALPFVVCPFCQGQVSDHCTKCKQTGFLPEHKWKYSVDDQLKAVRQKSCKK